MEVEVRWAPCGLGYVISVTETEFGRSKYADVIVNLIVNVIIQIIIPYGLVVGGNVVLVATLFKALKRRSKLTGESLWLI